MTHAILSASSSHRWMACPGSVGLKLRLEAQGYTLDRDSEHSRLGTAAHELAARCLRRKQDAAEYIGQWMNAETPHPIQVDEEMAQAVQVYLDHVRSLIEDPKRVLVFIEQLFDLASFREGMFGTADCVIYDIPTRTLYVIDYKHGAGVVVEVERNSQLMYYGLGSLLKLQASGLEVPMPANVRLTIVQPRAFHPRGPVREDSVGVGELVMWGEDLVLAADETDKPDAPLVPGEHCRFCPCLSRCPKLYENALESAQLVFADVPAPTVFDVVEGPTPVNQLTESQLQRALLASLILEPWFKSLKVAVQEKLERGEHVAGWKLVQKEARRAWAVDDFLVVQQLTSLGVDKAALYTEPSLVSPNQAEQAMKKAGLPPAKRKVLDDLVTRDSSGITLVPEADKRPAISNPLPFEVLTEE